MKTVFGKNNSSLKKDADRLSEAIDDSAAITRIWFLTVTQRTHQCHQLSGDRHLRHRNIFPVLPAEQLDFNSFPFSLDYLSWHALQRCFAEYIISTLSYSCMLPGHSKCASLMDCPDKAPWSCSEWPVETVRVDEKHTIVLNAMYYAH